MSQQNFNQYGTRRGNHEIMMRGTFANIRIKNFILAKADGGVPEGGMTKHWPDGEEMSIYDAAMKYQAEGVPLVVFAGAEYGNGSSRDWAAKGTRLLGVRAVIAESFERIHRSNLVGMGVLPLTFEPGTSWKSLGLKGDEQVTIHGLGETLKPRQMMEATIKFANGSEKKVPLLCRIATARRTRIFQERRYPVPTCCASSPRRKHYPSRLNGRACPGHFFCRHGLNRASLRGESDEAIQQSFPPLLDCFAALAMTLHPERILAPSPATCLNAADSRSRTCRSTIFSFCRATASAPK